MSSQLHERGIHALCFGTDGARVTEVRLGVRRTAVAAGLTGNHLIVLATAPGRPGFLVNK
jgi:hypothetical protein